MLPIKKTSTYYHKTGKKSENPPFLVKVLEIISGSSVKRKVDEGIIPVYERVPAMAG